MSDLEKRNIDERFTLWQRNVRDQYKNIPTEAIKASLRETAFPAAILMSQIEGDFNIGSVIRSANNFNFSKVFYYGKKRYDKRSACGVYNYTDVIHISSMEEIISLKNEYEFVALENNITKIVPIKDFVWKKNSMIVVGEENAGIQQDVLSICNKYIEIPSMGSVRSLNAAVAASIAMYDYINKFSCPS